MNQLYFALLIIIIVAVFCFDDDYDEAAKLELWEAETKALAIERIKANKESQLKWGE